MVIITLRNIYLLEINMKLNSFEIIYKKKNPSGLKSGTEGDCNVLRAFTTDPILQTTKPGFIIQIHCSRDLVLTTQTVISSLD